MTAIRRLAAARALLDTPTPATVPGQLPIPQAREAVPDGTFGGARPPHRWSYAEQKAHRVDLAAALGITDDYRPTTSTPAA
jgi:hypothetical protein